MLSKEEILAKNRKDNQKDDERDLKIYDKAYYVAFSAMWLLSAILRGLEFFYNLDTNIISRTAHLYMCITICAFSWYVLFASKKKKWIIFSIITTIISILGVFLFVTAFIKMI